MTNPVTVEHVIARFRPLSPQERVNAEAWIEDVWALLLERRPSLEDWLDDGEISESSVIRTVTAAVIRKLRNPDGKIEEHGDDYGFKRDSSTASGELYVKMSEMQDVTPSSRGRSRKSIRLVAYGES